MKNIQMKIPDAEPGSAYIPTLNQQGYMTATIDEFMQSFIDYAVQRGDESLDIGAAYGIASAAVLELGGKIIANDIDVRHLEILQSTISQKHRSNLSLNVDAFPFQTNFEQESLGAILIARVIHFLTPDEVLIGAQKLHKWLKFGGKVFLTAETPYLGLWRDFIPEYELRLAKKNLWAGEIEDVSLYAPERADTLPRRMLLMDQPTLKFAFERVGFEIERLETFSRPEFPDDVRLDGRESIGLICCKK